MSAQAVAAWHFLPADGLTRYEPRLPVRVGTLLTVDADKLALCTYGLHACVKAMDALSYAPGPLLCRVRLTGRIVHGDDKLVASRRRVLAMADATDTLLLFARQCAQDVLHLWDAPPVVCDYLASGDESIRAAAWAAARAAARAAAGDAAGAAAGDAAGAAAGAAAGDAARAAAGAAAWAAAGAAAWASTGAAARAAARDAQNQRLERLFADLLGFLP